jgi:hypothetical protein
MAYNYYLFVKESDSNENKDNLLFIQEPIYRLPEYGARLPVLNL